MTNTSIDPDPWSAHIEQIEIIGNLTVDACRRCKDLAVAGMETYAETTCGLQNRLGNREQWDTNQSAVAARMLDACQASANAMSSVLGRAMELSFHVVLNGGVYGPAYFEGTLAGLDDVLTYHDFRDSSRSRLAGHFRARPLTPDLLDRSQVLFSFVDEPTSDRSYIDLDYKAIVLEMMKRPSDRGKRRRWFGLF